MLALTGKAVEGDILTAVEVIPNSETQQHVWSKYKKDIRYQWYGNILYIDAECWRFSQWTNLIFYFAGEIHFPEKLISDGIS